MKFYKVFDPVFRCEFRLYIGSLEMFKEEIKRVDGSTYIDYLNENSNGCCLNLKTGIFMWMPEFYKQDVGCISVLSHEIYHAINYRLFDNCGIKYWKNGGETGAYYLAFIMKSFLEEIENG